MRGSLSFILSLLIGITIGIGYASQVVRAELQPKHHIIHRTRLAFDLVPNSGGLS